MEFEALKKEIHQLAVADQLDKAEQRLLETKDCFRGKALGRWHHLFAQVVRRTHPDDRQLFLDACSIACRHLQTDHAELCDLYLTQTAAAMAWGEWNLARSYIRRIRAFFRRYPANYQIQREQGLVLFNEAHIELTCCNFSRAVTLASQALAMLDRYAFPAEEAARRFMTATLRITVAEGYLRLGEHAKALESLARIDPAFVPKRTYARYCRLNSWYWLMLNVVSRAEEWFNKIGAVSSWEPDWEATRLELEAGIARAKGDLETARRLLMAAIDRAAQTGNKALMSILRHQLTSIEGEKKE